MSTPRQIGEGYYRKALEYRQAGDYISALNEIRLAISNYPHDASFHREREAIEELLDPAALSDEILMHVRQGDYARAVKCAEALSAQYPDKYNSLSDQVSGVGREEAGAQAFPSTLVPSAEGFAREKNYGLAMKLLAEAIMLNPRDQSLQRRMEEFGRYHRAKLMAEESRKHYPDRIDEAIAAMERAVELSPGDVEYRRALERMVGERPKLFYMEAKRLFSQGKLEEAGRALSKAREFTPSSQDCLILREKIEKAIVKRKEEEEKKEFKRSRSRIE